MKNFQMIFVVSAVVAGALAALLIHRQGQAKWQTGESSLQEQSNQLAILTRDGERLSNLTAHATPIRINYNAAELAKLRAELASLQKQTNDLAHRSDTNRPARPSQSARLIGTQRPPEYWTQLHLLAGTRTQDAMSLGGEWEHFASEHQQQSPASLDELTTYMAKDNRAFSGTNQFEIVYQGSLDDLKGLPWGSVAVVREVQPWPGPDGTWMRVYGFPSGASQIVSSDYVQAFEAQHVISPPPMSPSGQ
jgi:hypothetical protein